MARHHCPYTVGEIKALVGPLAGLVAEDVTGYAIVITSKTRQRMVCLGNGETPIDRIQLLGQGLLSETLDRDQEDQEGT